jgi:alpha-beta hydrolase superfamily lysophospholipase
MGEQIESLASEERLERPGVPSLLMRSWRPPGRTRGIVVLVHGFNAHSESFAWAGQQFASNGYAVYAGDLRGRGRSDGERFYVNEFSEYVDDVSRVVDVARSRDGEIPLFVLGHSAGGVVACLLACKATPRVAGLVCESFALQLPAPGLALAALKALSHILPHAHVVRLKNEDFSRDPDVVRGMNDDPLVSGEVQPAQTIAALVRADAAIRAEVPLFTSPVLLLHGTADKATEPAGSQWFFDHVGSPDKALKLYEGHFHDLLRDVGKERVVTDILAWLQRQTPSE